MTINEAGLGGAGMDVAATRAWLRELTPRSPGGSLVWTRRLVGLLVAASGVLAMSIAAWLRSPIWAFGAGFALVIAGVGVSMWSRRGVPAPVAGRPLGSAVVDHTTYAVVLAVLVGAVAWLPFGLAMAVSPRWGVVAGTAWWLGLAFALDRMHRERIRVTAPLRVGMVSLVASAVAVLVGAGFHSEAASAGTFLLWWVGSLLAQAVVVALIVGLDHARVE